LHRLILDPYLNTVHCSRSTKHDGSASGRSHFPVTKIVTNTVADDVAASWSSDSTTKTSS
jgi:hypothetical protein